MRSFVHGCLQITCKFVESGALSKFVCLEKHEISRLFPSGANFQTLNIEALVSTIPSIFVFRTRTEGTDLPSIPVHPISYSDARKILAQLAGPLAPEAWQGGLKMPYRLGTELRNEGWKISLEVDNEKSVMPIFNTFGYIYGSEEPDR